MAVDVLILNTAVADLRRADFQFADRLVGKGGLAKCRTEDMPDYSQEQIKQWIDEGSATAGGPGNTAPLIARTGLKVAVGVNLGKGDYDGLDAQGRFFYDVLVANGVDMSATHVHPTLPTGTTFIHNPKGDDRGGIGTSPTPTTISISRSSARPSSGSNRGSFTTCTPACPTGATPTAVGTWHSSSTGAGPGGP